MNACSWRLFLVPRQMLAVNDSLQMTECTHNTSRVHLTVKTTFQIHTKLCGLIIESFLNKHKRLHILQLLFNRKQKNTGPDKSTAKDKRGDIFGSFSTSLDICPRDQRNNDSVLWDNGRNIVCQCYILSCT